MTAHDIRQEARHLLRNLVGKGKLFLFPILVGFLSGFLQTKNTWEQQTQLYDYQDALPQITSTASTSYTIFQQLLSFIMTVMLMSAAYTLLEAYRQKRTEATYEDSFRAFNSPYLFRLFLLYLTEILLILPWILLMIVPLFILILYSVFSGGMAVDSSVGLLNIPIIFGFVMFIIKTYAYSQANFILFDRVEEGGSLNPFDIIKESVQLMKGHKFDLFILHLSFIGWLLLIPLTLGLASFYVIPYHWAAQTIFYDQLKHPKLPN